MAISDLITPKKLLLFGLLTAIFATTVIDVLAPLLNPEIAQTFNIPPGTAIQLSAFSTLAGVITGLILSAFSIRFRYKTLLVLGVFCILICSLGLFLAPTFWLVQIFYSLNGVGSVIVSVMVTTIIGELYPLNKKAKRISWVLITGQLAILIGNPATGFIANAGGITGWRSALLWFMLPITIASLLLVILLVPNDPKSTQFAHKTKSFLNGYKQIISNKSAVAILVNSFLAGAYFTVNIFAPSFLKFAFAVPPDLRSLVPVVASILLISGMLTGGFLVNKVGRKDLLVGSAIPAIILSVIGYPLSIFIPNVWILLTFRFASAFVGGMPLVAGPALALEQTPLFRGTMISLISAISGIGATVGILVGGPLLNYINNPLLGYPVVMIMLGTMGIAGTLIIFFFTKDPCKPQAKPLQSP